MNVCPQASTSFPSSNPPRKRASIPRATKYAAQHLLMTTYLTRAASGDFQKAADLGKSIINSGAFSLLPAYKDLWTFGNEVNKEVIWSVQFTPDLLTTGPGNSSHLYHTMAYDLEAGMPYLFIEQFVAQAPQSSQGQPTGRMRILLSIAGRWDGGK